MPSRSDPRTRGSQPGSGRADRRRSPGPLDSLPRPLSERDRGGRGRRRVLTAGLVAGVVAIIAYGAATSIPGAPFDPTGAVAGVAVSSPGTDGDAVASPSAGPVSSTASSDPNVGSEGRPTAEPTATPAPTPAPPASLTGYRSPLPHGRLTLPFGPTPWGSRIVDGEKMHDGIDLATFCGDRVVAAHAGTVMTAGRHYDKYMGWVGDLQPYLDRLDKKKLYPTLPIVIVVDDGNGYRSVYAHFSKVVVKKGETIEAGQFIGYEGQTGRASGCHVHYGLFSPLETATFGIDPAVVKRMKVPKHEIARIDPLIILPQHADKPDPTPSAATASAAVPTPEATRPASP
jgi:murein DD-endopeptidase MepM/ murein hydrolase activator NlpD